MFRRLPIRALQTRGVTTIHSPAEPREPETLQTWMSDWRGLSEVLFIAGTGTFGVYEIYKGMFMMPQHIPTAEELIERMERKRVREEEARWARLAQETASRLAKPSESTFSMSSSPSSEASSPAESSESDFTAKDSSSSSTSTPITTSEFDHPLIEFDAVVLDQVDKTE